MKGVAIQPRGTPFHPTEPSQSILDIVQRARQGAERGTRRAGQGGHAARLEYH